MSAETTITADCEHGAWIVHVGGPLDAHGVLRLCASLSRLTHLGTHDLVVDLQPVSDADEDALAALASAGRLAARAGLGFAVLAPGGAARRAIDTAGLGDALHVCDDEREAIARVAAASHRTRRRTAVTAEQLQEEAA
jgi:anti-anti-sigma factor